MSSFFKQYSTNSLVIRGGGVKGESREIEKGKLMLDQNSTGILVPVSIQIIFSISIMEKVLENPEFSSVFWNISEIHSRNQKISETCSGHQTISRIRS